MGDDPAELEDYYQELVRGILDDFPQLAGLILRIGESDGNDVQDPIRTRLHLRNAGEANRLLRALLPEFEQRGQGSDLPDLDGGRPPHRRSDLAPRHAGKDAGGARLAQSHRFDETRRERFFPLPAAQPRVLPGETAQAVGAAGPPGIRGRGRVSVLHRLGLRTLRAGTLTSGKHRGHFGVVPDRRLASLPAARLSGKPMAATSGSGSTRRPPSPSSNMANPPIPPWKTCSGRSGRPRRWSCSITPTP